MHTCQFTVILRLNMWIVSVSKIGLISGNMTYQSRGVCVLYLDCAALFELTVFIMY